MFRELIVWSTDSCRQADDSLIRLAEFAGVPAINRQVICGKGRSEDLLKNILSKEGVCFAATAKVFMKNFRRPKDIEWLRTNLFEKGHYAFLYGFSGSAEETAVLHQLTESRILSVQPIEKQNRTYSVQHECRLTGQHFRATGFGTEESSADMSFTHKGKLSTVHDKMMCEAAPFFLEIEMEKSRLFLAGCNQFCDVDTPAPKNAPLLAQGSAIIPALIFFREAFNEGCWHNPSPKACLIIDDPVLTMKYGFLDFRELANLMQRRNLSTSIAFIPWNRSRTKQDVAGLFLFQPEKLSLCIHGCDHTWAEFGANDENLLDYKARQSLLRMEEHRKLTRIPFDPIMVFPQGIFSARAMRALKNNYFLAAVNTTPYAVGENDPPLTLAELLGPAVIRYSNFPLFLRQYPENDSALQFYMFLGKPVLIVEHHGFFRNGMTSLLKIEEALNASNPRLKWENLARICCESHLKKNTLDGKTHVRFYTNTFRYKNDTGNSEEVVLIGEMRVENEIRHACVNGKRIEHIVTDDSIVLPMHLEPGESADIKIEHAKALSCNTISLKMQTNSQTTNLRRYLSEFRDNYVDTNPVLSYGYENLRKFVKRSK